MPVSWFKRWFGRKSNQPIKLSDISASINTLSEAITTDKSGTQKGLRRLSMAQKQQSEAIALLTQESSSLKFALAQRSGLTLTYEQVLYTLDNLEKVNHAAINTVAVQGIIAPLATRAREDFLRLCELAAIAEIGKPYPAKGCEVVGAVEALKETQWPTGAVVEVLQQGYQTAAGDIVRAAKVIVSGETNTAQSIKQLEDISDDQ